MKIAVYGGSFNPPHVSHVRAAGAAYQALQPDKFIVMPAADPPHKDLPEGSPSPEERLLMTQLAFRGMPEAEVSDLEIARRGESYTADTVEQLFQIYPGSQVTLIVGTDMLLYFEKWHRFRWLLENAELAVLSREKGDEEDIRSYSRHLRDAYGARVTFIELPAQPLSSSDIREELRRRGGVEDLPPAVYARIIRMRSYGAKPSFPWLREQAYAMLKPNRVAHVQGCEEEAVRLAERWGADAGSAAEAAILHDITKKLSLDEQLILCEKYGIMIDSLEAESAKLLHSRTGAALSRDLFGVPEDIYEAIRWHTTGRAGMSLLEKIIYMADYIEPNRRFDGVEELRRLAYENLNAAMVLGLQMSVSELEARGTQVHVATQSALDFYRKDN